MSSFDFSYWSSILFLQELDKIFSMTLHHACCPSQEFGSAQLDHAMISDYGSVAPRAGTLVGHSICWSVGTFSSVGIDTFRSCSVPRTLHHAHCDRQEFGSARFITLRLISKFGCTTCENNWSNKRIFALCVCNSFRGTRNPSTRIHVLHHAQHPCD